MCLMYINWKLQDTHDNHNAAFTAGLPKSAFIEEGELRLHSAANPIIQAAGF